MVDSTKAEGLKFMFNLNQASDDKDKLLELAQTALRESHSKRTFVERCGKDLNLLSLDLGATVGHMHVLTNKEVSTKDKLYMIIKRYVALTQKDNSKTSEKKAIDSFCSELQKRYPQEYGAETRVKTTNTPLFNLVEKTIHEHSIV